ncbi:hypothetical protein HYZ78_01025 [Candidatus Microgenomates bacterium]|nr:hypothetical protein [Candidatus Microgenomates bacterium]
MRRYSRLLSVEERKHKRRAFVYAILAFLIFLAFIFYGLPTVAKLSANLSDLRPPAEDSDKTRPAKPRFTTSETATNSATLTLSGVDQSGVDVTIFQNGRDLGSIRANDTGSFEKEVQLTQGVNRFTARAKNEKGVEGENSETLIITLDTSPPVISITEPTDKIFTEEKVTLKGEVDEESEIYVNDKTVVIDDQNSFSTNISLTSGENKIIIKAIDKAGNESTFELVLTRS